MRIHRLLAAAAGLAVLAAVALASPAYAANLLSNPGFETGNLSGWSCSRGSVVSSPVHSGDHALAGAANDFDNARCAQTVSVQPGTAYQLTAWVRGNYVYLGVTGGASTWTPSASGYTKLTVDFTTGSSQTSAEVYLHGWYAQGTYYADDVSLDGPGGQDPGAPAAPGPPRVTGTTDSSISLSWSAPSGTVTGYRVYEGDTVKATVSGTSTTISGLAACSSHTYTVTAYNSEGESARSEPVTGRTTGCSGGGSAMAAPYLYEGWGDPPSPTTVMNATGIKQFTMAFMLSGGGCTPAWDSTRPLHGGVDEQAINEIRANGGDVEISFGGWSGNKLGPNCSSPEALAGAYQQVIDAYDLEYIDIDIENTDEFENAVVQDRILNALKIVNANNPGITTIVTFGTTTSGPNWWGNRLINQAAALDANIDVFTIMPFDFGGSDMYADTVSASEGLKSSLQDAFGWSEATAYAHMGISGMNGLSDQRELTTPATWTRIRDWANGHGLARLSFWSVNRDRPCPGGGVVSHCSGIDQQNWEFTAITAGFTG